MGKDNHTNGTDKSNSTEGKQVAAVRWPRWVLNYYLFQSGSSQCETSNSIVVMVGKHSGRILLVYLTKFP